MDQKLSIDVRELRDQFTKETGVAAVFANRIPYMDYIEWRKLPSLKRYGLS